MKEGLTPSECSYTTPVGMYIDGDDLAKFNVYRTCSKILSGYIFF